MKKWFRLMAKAGEARLCFLLIVATAVVLFALFFIVGFNRPYRPDPNFNEPALTSAVMVFVIAVFVLALAVTVWAMLTALRRGGSGQAVINGVPAMKIAIGVAAVTTVTLVVTFLAGSSAPFSVNGKVFDGALALKTADMFVASSAVMMTLALVAVVYGTVRSYLNNR